jgi:hypothetical protein
MAQLEDRIDGINDGTHRYYWDPDTFNLGFWCSIVTTPYVIALAALNGAVSIAGWLVIATVIIWLAFWFPATDVCAQGSVIYLRKPNRFVDIYEDSKSHHWVVAEAQEK